MKMITNIDESISLPGLKQKFSVAYDTKDFNKLESCIFDISLIIQQHKNEKEVYECFLLLDKIQTSLAKWIFKLDVNVTPILKKFVYQCDRLDDPDLRKHLFQLIKENKFLRD